MVAVPVPAPVTEPVDEPIFAMPALLLVHVPPITVSVKVVLPPKQTPNVPVIAAGDCKMVIAVSVVQPSADV